MTKFDKIRAGSDLRTIGKSNEVVLKIQNQKNFDKLFQQLYSKDRVLVMRTADSIEKISQKNPQYLKSHKKEILDVCIAAKNIELKWHLALLVSRLILTQQEFERVWQLLMVWATDKRESRIVRVNSIQGLFNLRMQNRESIPTFNEIITKVRSERIPSLNARIRKLAPVY